MIRSRRIGGLRMNARSFFWIFLASHLWLSWPATGQQNGRLSDLKSQGLDLFQSGKYAESAGKLEEVWEIDQSDAKVAEYLGMSYLYGEHNSVKAGQAMKKAIANGGQATFLIFHSHEHLAGEIINQYCTGRMSILPGKLIFVPDSGEHLMTVTAGDLKDFSVLGGAPGRIHIKTNGKSYTFLVKSHTRAEAVLLATIAQQNLTP